jgi:hypothetical protein
MGGLGLTKMRRPKVGDDVLFKYGVDPRKSIQCGTGRVIDMDRKTDQVFVVWYGDEDNYPPPNSWEDVEDLEVLE